MGRSRYRFYSRTVGVNDIVEVSAFGRFLTLLSNDQTEKIKVSIGEDPFEEMPAGVSVELSENENFFTKIQFKNNGANPAVIEFALSAGRIFDNRVNITGSVFDTIRDELRGDTAFEGFGDVAVGTSQAIVIASNANRKSAIIQAFPTNTGVIYIGFDSSVSSTKKVVTLLAGQVYSVDDYRGALHAISSIASQGVSYGEV